MVRGAELATTREHHRAGNCGSGDWTDAWSVFRVCTANRPAPETVSPALAVGSLLSCSRQRDLLQPADALRSVDRRPRIVPLGVVGQADSGAIVAHGGWNHDARTLAAGDLAVPTLDAKVADRRAGAASSGVSTIQLGGNLSRDGGSGCRLLARAILVQCQHVGAPLARSGLVPGGIAHGPIHRWACAKRNLGAYFWPRRGMDDRRFGALDAVDRGGERLLGSARAVDGLATDESLVGRNARYRSRLHQRGSHRHAGKLERAVTMQRKPGRADLAAGNCRFRPFDTPGGAALESPVPILGRPMRLARHPCRPFLLPRPLPSNPSQS